MVKISIITPVYCDTSYKIDWLNEMIESVQAQSVTDWEIILINDKSPLSLDPVKMKHSADNRLRWLENAMNSGPAMTRNTAVALAESECILPLDSDDMLASEEALEIMYDAWLMNTTKTIYGNVQIYKEIANGLYQRSKVHQLASYSFEGAMNLQWGIMPVTTMHSKEAHYAAGGWKADLEYGREDLEYWIACGRAGFCGQKINYATLLYRKHEKSRDYKLKFENKQLETMQQKIKALHSDIYSGRFPMACCGKGSSSNTAVNDPAIISQQVAQKSVRIVTTLEDDYEEKDLEWVAYRGLKQGRSGSILTSKPANTPKEYPILGTGHVFQIHKAHRKLFEARQHLGFEMNQPDPRQQPEPEPTVAPVETPQVIEVPKPQMSTVVSLDSIAAGTREVVIQPMPEEVIIEPNLPEAVSNSMLSQRNAGELGLSPKVTETLNEAGYTVEELATETPQKLSSLPGIGIKTANKIITKAEEFLKS
jgi:hypothetical protein